MAVYNVIGTMSGTSLDGLDIAHCTFELSANNWNFQINVAQTIKFLPELEEKLTSAINMNGLELMKLNNSLGDFIGDSVNNFISSNNINKNEINAIASHGHTIFHQPELNLTTQIGNGANISSLTKLPVICDFRTADISLGGQGAPLVPIGDKLLFSKYDYCINLGGIANISFEKENERIAFDICPVNIVLNSLSQKLGSPYDKNGEHAKNGKIIPELLQKLNELEYFKKDHPKSLGIEWIKKEVFPLIEASNRSTKDKLRTYVEHIAFQITNNIKLEQSSVLFTGGGTLNSFLTERIKANGSENIIIPSKQIIDFKEALIFAFLGVLRIRKEANCLKTVTGAASDNIGGCIYQSF